ncbi:MAG TPA: 2'-5' RNA ligase family protein, partial [Reyranella sp.]|nr:2'-5' RNA ligase family protein [Reyranella sp.]
RRPFWFVLDRLVRHDMTPPSRAAYLYAVPADGGAELTSLHEELNPMAVGEPFEPHITLGWFDRAADAEQVARIVERQHLPMHGRIEELALLRRGSDALEVVKSVRL